MFFMRFGDQIKQVTKIKEDEFTSLHREILSQITLQQGNLNIPRKQWNSLFLGSGEEKAVFCICDHNNRVFAIEAIDEKHYLNGRFIDGNYFFEMRVQGLVNQKLNPKALVFAFTGLIKVREFVYGYEWARFSFNPGKKNILDFILTSWLQFRLESKFMYFQQYYKDVHGGNVMFEICDFKHKGVIAVIKDLSGKTKLVKVRLQAIDVR
jgi:hypothetical protein